MTTMRSVNADQAAWEAMLDPKLRTVPAYRYVADDPNLPRVLIIGDSISVGYTEPVRTVLAGKANVHRIPVNGGDTRRGLTHLESWLGAGPWAVVHFNFGLHDLKHLKDGKLDLSGPQLLTVPEYRTNLECLVARLKTTGATLIWATTTPVPEGANGRLNGDDLLFNAAALGVMRKSGVTVNDLHAHVLPELDKHQIPRNVHFTPEGSAFLGRKVATEIEKVLRPDPFVRVRRFQQECPMVRARRPANVAAVIENTGDAEFAVSPRLTLPPGVRLLSADVPDRVRIAAHGECRLVWRIEADEAGTAELALRVETAGRVCDSATLPVLFLPPVQIERLPYIPEPKPVSTPLLIGAHHCPLWEADKPKLWDNVLKHPERTPALGFYSQEHPEVSDWETKWAVEHGVSFFIYCWYRTSQGGPVKTRFSSAIHDALFKSRFVDKMKFTIMWENQSRGNAGVADEKDLMTNLLPFWIETYFLHPGYLKVDNKPVLYVYRPEFLVQDLGGVDQVARAFDLMRQACRARGFDGLTILGEYRGLDAKHLNLMKQLGLDYTFAYCWHVKHNPSPQQAIAAQMDYIAKTQAMGILPQVITVSQAWSGWHDEGSIWKIPPAEFAMLLAKARDVMATLPQHELGSRMLLLDNWNEWGEGHYLAPYREYGFGYLDAVRSVFAPQSGPHVDLIPEDIGLGPYDASYKANLLEQLTFAREAKWGHERQRE